jgi:hypothetical protein
MMDAGELLIPAIDQVAFATFLAMPAAPAEEADADALPKGPALNVATKRIDDTHGLMPGHARPFYRKNALDRRCIRVADATGLHAKANLFITGLDERLLRQFQLPRRDGLHSGISLRTARHGTFLHLENLAERYQRDADADRT